MDTSPYRVEPGERVKLSKRATKVDPPFDREKGRVRMAEFRRRLNELQELLFAESKHAVLVVLQAMDAGGKDSTIRRVFGPLNPQGVRVSNFMAPNPTELKHDFLWRIHAKAPARGMIRVFNRSHYEDVLIVRVKGLVPKARWSKRYDHINAFEHMLADEGTTIVKFFLHISKDYQRQRLQRRLDRPEKHWKFNPEDLTERARWDDYQRAIEAALGRCSTKHAPWYVIPAERRWYRDLLIAQVMIRTLERLKMKYPEPGFDPATITIE